MNSDDIDKLKEELAREKEARALAEEKIHKCEADFHAVIDNIQDVYYRTDLNGILIMGSRSWLEISGYDSIDECLGKNIAETFYFDPGEREAFLAILSRDGSVTNYETVLKRKDGSPITIETNSHIYYDSEGKPAGVEGILRDISERKAAEEELRRSERLLKSIVNASPIPQFVIDREHRIVHWNRALEEYSGINADDMKGTKMQWQAFYGSERPCLADLIIGEEPDALGKWYSGKYRRSSLIEDAFEAVDFFPDIRGGTWLYFTAAPIRDESGAVIGAVETLEDITGNKRFEDELRESRKEIGRHAFFLEALLTAIPIPVFYKDKEGKYLGCNELYSEIMGIERERFIGKTVFDLWPGEMAEMYNAKDRELLESGRTQVYEYKIKSSSGEIRSVIFRKSLFSNEDGEIGGIVGAYFDITDQKAAQEALKLSEEKFRTIFNDSPVGIVQTTLDGHILSANRAFCDMMGYSGSEIQELTIADISFEGDFEKERPMVRKLHDGLTSYHSFEKRYRTRSGECVWGHVSIAYIRDEAGKPLTAVGIIENISDRKKADEEVKRMENQLLQSQKAEALGTLAGGIAHDFNNILSAIIGYTELAKIHVAKPAVASAELDQVLKASDRAKSLVNQILAFSRKASIEYTPVDLQFAISDTLKMLRSVIPSDINIVPSLKENIVILSDPTQVHQIIMNLSINAAQAMEKDGGTLSVELDSVVIGDGDTKFLPELTPGDYALIRVRDTGLGMSEEVRERIFLPYFTTRETGKGTGLGLAVIQGIIKKHKGTIICRSEPGAGTTFEIYLPELKAVMDIPVSSADEEIVRGRGRILFVDDEPSLTAMGSEMLKTLGYDVLTENSSVKALDIFTANPYAFDLVITDMTMPGMTGDRLAERIKSLRGDMPVIICTGYSDRISDERIKELGVSMLIMKPVEMRHLSSAVRKILTGEE